VTVSRADIDTMQVYPTLNFQVSIDWIWRSIARATQTGFSFAVKYLTSNAILFFLLKMWRWFIGFFYCHVLTVVFFFQYLRNWKPEYMRRRDFWDSSLEKRYNEYKKDTTRPSLKVGLITKCFLHNSSLLPYILLPIFFFFFPISHSAWAT
jgi:hypothetical protein